MLAGVFSEPHVIQASGESSLQLLAADIDGDNDLDIVLAGSDLGWYENRSGMGDFVRGASLSQMAGRFGYVEAADFDCDGDIDLLSTITLPTSSFYSDTGVVWHENISGTGEFQDHIIDTFEQRRVTATTADYDGDEYSDVLMAWGATGNFQEGTLTDGALVRYRNIDGKGDFGDQRQIDALGLFRPASLHGVDVDGDGDADIVARWDEVSFLSWYENTDGGGLYSGRSANIMTPRTRDSYLLSTHFADFDGDGDLDILGGSSDGIDWYLNSDGQGSFVQQAASEDFENGLTIRRYSFADLDWDGDVDVAAVLTDNGEQTLDWYENTDGQFATWGNGPSAEDVSSILAADIDGDGDADVITAQSRGRVVWYRNASTLERAGDTDRDLDFDQVDLVLALQAAKYMTGEPATWEEGDWNDDGLFDQLDVIAALQTENYLQGAYAADAPDAVFTETRS